MDNFKYFQDKEVLKEHVQSMKKEILEGRLKNKSIVTYYFSVSIYENHEENEKLAYEILEYLASKYDVEYSCEIDYDHDVMKKSLGKTNGEYLNVTFYLDV